MGPKSKEETAHHNGHAQKPAGTGTDEKKTVIEEAVDWPSNVGTLYSDVGRPLYLRLLHWGPIVAILIVFMIGMTTSTVSVSWWPLTSIGGCLQLSIFITWNYLTLFNMLKAAFIGGGYVPRNWRPPSKDHEDRLQYCLQCQGFKPPRSHHCTKCDRCVLKMDHHCPWINNCVGHRNHVYFIRFLLFAVLGCTHAAVVLSTCLYRTVVLIWGVPSYRHRDMLLFSSIYTFLAAILALSLSLGVIIAVGFLLYVQLKCVLANRTAIEDYICLKADSRRGPENPFTYPYDLGWRRNWSEIMHGGSLPKGNGVWWPIRHGCTQFTFSEEQLIQKQIKRHAARQLRVCQEFKGGWFGGWRYGPRVLFCQPCSEESRIGVRVGEVYAITRGNKHWVYGHRVFTPYEQPIEHIGQEGDTQQPTSILRPLRGWFPRACVMVEGQNQPTTSVTTTSERDESSTDEATATSVQEDDDATQEPKKHK